jgi:hypothetical protein
MAKRYDNKLNRLQQLPEGLLVDAAWLERHGYSSSLRSQYVSAGWLHSVAPRVYRRSDGPLEWQHVVTSLQAFLDCPQTVGGRTALEEQGYAHYLNTKTKEVHLYGPTKPPTWLATLPIDVEFVWHSSRKLFPDDPSIMPVESEFPPVAGDSILPGNFLLMSGGRKSWGLRLSSPERAFLELLDELPDRESFHQVDVLMGGLANLSPRRLQTLLESCRSVKVKRLFFYFADRHGHAWLSKLEKNAVDLGAGKRSLVAGGRLDPHYNITVPKDLDAVS